MVNILLWSCNKLTRAQVINNYLNTIYIFNFYCCLVYMCIRVDRSPLILHSSITSYDRLLYLIIAFPKRDSLTNQEEDDDVFTSRRMHVILPESCKFICMLYGFSIWYGCLSPRATRWDSETRVGKPHTMHILAYTGYGGRRSPAVACWAFDHWVVGSNPLRGKFRH